MCELFGFSGARPSRLNDELQEFFSHSVDHPHAWGLAVLDGPGQSLEREPVRAIDSAYLERRMKADVLTSTALAHIRRATVGADRYDNCHPFRAEDASGRVWTFIHNGTVFDHSDLDAYFDKQKGTCDSERVLLYLMDHITGAAAKKGAPLNAEERFAAFDQMVCKFNPHNKINLMAYDGELLYAHTNYAGTMFVRDDQAGAMVATTPLGQGDWKPAPFTQLFAFRAGELAFLGTNHGHEYFLDQERLDAALRDWRHL